MNEKNSKKRKLFHLMTLNNLKLQGKFFIYFVGLVLIVVMGVLITLFYFQKKMLQKQAQDKAFSLARTLAYSSLNAILTNDYLILQMLIDSMMDGSDIISISIIDTTGKVIVSSKPELRGTEQIDSLSQKAIFSNTFIIQKVLSSYGDDIWDTAVPIFELNKRIGTARIKYSVEDSYKGLLRIILCIGLISVLLSLGLAYRFSHSISRPILRAVKLAKEYGKGNFNCSFILKRKDEIGELVESLNKLSHELKTLIDEKIVNENILLIGEFASYIIHDLKNPINGIHLLSDGLNRKILDNNPIKEYTKEILTTSQRLYDFVTNILDISRWTKINPQVLLINELIEHVLNNLNTTTFNIIRNYDYSMPPIQADYQMLLMVFQNLISNAIEAINKNGKISIITKWTGNAEIIISDNGVGISDESLNTIFRPFFSMKNHGHGLGLAIVKKLILLHNGKITVKSEIGKGTIFTVELPGDIKS
jgi:signal transduction histidine kinase